MENLDNWLGKMIRMMDENPEYAEHLETAGFGYMTREQVQTLWTTDKTHEPEEEKTVKIEIREMGGVYQARGLFQWSVGVYDRFARKYPRWKGRRGNAAQAMLGLQWFQEKRPGVLKKIGDMRFLHQEITRMMQQSQ